MAISTDIKLSYKLDKTRSVNFSLAGDTQVFLSPGFINAAGEFIKIGETFGYIIPLDRAIAILQGAPAQGQSAYQYLSEAIYNDFLTNNSQSITGILV